MIKEIMDNNNLDGILVSDLRNIRYLTGFKASAALVLLTKKQNYLFVDARYYEMAKAQVDNYQIILIEQTNQLQLVNDIIVANNIKRLGFEADQLVVSKYLEYQKNLQTTLVGLSLAKLRMIKSETEIALIKKACAITDQAYEKLLTNIKVGMSELDVEKKLKNIILELGADDFSFEPIIASGKRSSLPHGIASEKIIEAGDFITIDFGVFYQGYASDMTRTFVMSKINNVQLAEIYDIVLQAQKLAITSLKPGIQAFEVDKIARDYISEKGYGDYFNHGLGHSFGLEIHEAPFLNRLDQTILSVGMVLTIEPGIYLPEVGGVRIEDDILITEDGYEILTKADKKLIIIEEDENND